MRSSRCSRRSPARSRRSARVPDQARTIRRLDTSHADFAATLSRLTAFDTAQDEAVDTSVASILADVRARGDAAVLEYTALFDHVKQHSVAALEFSSTDLKSALDGLPAAQSEALAV